MRIVVEKAKRRLVLRQGRRILFRCGCHLGSAPDGHKRREGDGRTPEGRYFVCSKNPQSRYHLALGVSYPNERDARTGYRCGVIDASACADILRAQRLRRRPDWETALGGWIMIHGEPGDGRSGTGDWTAGCIALENRDIEMLYRFARRGMPVIILP